MLHLEIGTPILHITSDCRASDAVLRCSGEVDFANVHWVELALTLLRRTHPVRLEVDLRELTFFDGSLIRALLAIRQERVREGQDLVVRASPRGEHLLRLVQLDSLLSTAAEAGPPAQLVDAGHQLCRSR